MSPMPDDAQSLPSLSEADQAAVERWVQQQGLGSAVTDVEPLTGVASELAECTTAAQLVRHGISPTQARIYSEIVSDPTSWVEIIATQRHPGGCGQSECSHRFLLIGDFTTRCPLDRSTPWVQHRASG